MPLANVSGALRVSDSAARPTHSDAPARVTRRGFDGHSSAAKRVATLLATLALLTVATGSAAVGAEERTPSYRVTEQRSACASYEPLRRPFFGDTHVHTTHSQDASTQDTRITPREAYRFARGEALAIQPYDEAGQGQRIVQLEAPLDFAVVTDHAEQIGEVHICKTPGAPGHESLVCKIYRGMPRAAFYLMNGRYALGMGRWGFCGEAGEPAPGRQGRSGSAPRMPPRKPTTAAPLAHSRASSATSGPQDPAAAPICTAT